MDTSIEILQWRLDLLNGTPIFLRSSSDLCYICQTPAQKILCNRVCDLEWVLFISMLNVIIFGNL